MQKFFLINLVIVAIFSFQISFSQKVELGIDVLINEKSNLLTNKKVAILTNFAGRTKSGSLSIEALLATSNINLQLIFTPEHGFYGNVAAGENVNDSKYMNIPIVSLYGNGKKIPIKYESDFDVLLVDLQDIGIRAYTYISTLYYVMQSAAELGKEIIVLDRPNPLGGVSIDGNVLEKEWESFIGIIPISYIHGLTIGEIAMMINEENWLSKDMKIKKCDLKIIQMKGWERWMQWEDTGLMWFPTSPNIPTVDAIRGAAMLGWIGELSLFSVGIGTNLPFQYFGFPTFSNDFFDTFNNFEFNGAKLYQAHFLPVFGKYANQLCKGFILKFEKTNNFTPYSNGIDFLLHIRENFPAFFNIANIEENKQKMFKKATGTSDIFDLLFANKSPDKIRKAASKGLIEFINLREKYLLY